MEVKIKQGKEMIDATIEMVDGVMVVSPKGKMCKFKDGDVLASDKSKVIYIFKENVSEDANIGYIGIDNNQDLNLTESQWGNLIFRPATEEEKKKLFDKLAQEGWEWNPDTKELVKLKWKPSVGQHFYYVEYDNESFAFIANAYTYAFEDQIERDKVIAKGWCFKTSKECQEFCNRLNGAISQVK